MNRNQLFPLEKVQSMVHLGVCFDSNLTSRDHISEKTRMWANAQPDGHPAKHRWRPLFNAAKFG